MQTNSFILKAWGKKLIALLLVFSLTEMVAFATLGDGKEKKSAPRKLLLSNKMAGKPGTFSLQSGYSFRGNQVINLQENKYINISTVATYQQGHTTYVLPVKKKVSLNLSSQNKVSSATVGIKF